MGRYPAKSHSSLWKCTPKKYSRQTAFGFGSIPCEKSHQPSELCSEKAFRPDNLWLWIYIEQKASPAFGDVPRKNVYARPLSAAFSTPIVRHPKRSAAMTRKRVAPDSLRLWIYSEQKASPAFEDLPRKKRLRPPAFGLRATPREKPLQPSATYPEKTFTPASLWLPGYAPRKVSPALRNVPRKNVHTCRPSALSPYLAKSPESARKRALKKRLRPPAFGRRATPRKKSGKRSETYPEKTFTPVGLRPPGYTLRKAPKAVGNVA